MHLYMDSMDELQKIYIFIIHEWILKNFNIYNLWIYLYIENIYKSIIIEFIQGEPHHIKLQIDILKHLRAGAFKYL